MIYILGTLQQFKVAPSSCDFPICSYDDTLCPNSIICEPESPHYFEILEDLLIAVRIPVFSKRSSRRLSQHDKFYYFDSGVFQQLRPKGILDSPEEIGGAALETLFLQQLRAFIDYAELDLKIYFWRTSSGIEVDFIVYGEAGLFAFELKNRSYVNRRDLSGLKNFKKEYDMTQSFLIYTGNHVEKMDNIYILPIQVALNRLLDILNSSEFID